MIDQSLLATAEFERARQHLVLALDVDDLADAIALTELLSPYVGTVKVGLELYLAAGRQSVIALRKLDVDVFLDLKLHDIPTTVERSARVVGALGARYLTVHTSGGHEMVHAAVKGLSDGANSIGVLPAIAVGVTILTSDAEAPPAELERRSRIALLAGCGALVCAAPDLPITRLAAPGLLTVVPGTRPAGIGTDDQQRTATPKEALALGADLLVVGRPITKAQNPGLAAFELACSLIPELLG
jgi:orotidine-5'-phosphate decarboxylase